MAKMARKKTQQKIRFTSTTLPAEEICRIEEDLKVLFFPTETSIQAYATVRGRLAAISRENSRKSISIFFTSKSTTVPATVPKISSRFIRLEENQE